MTKPSMRELWKQAYRLTRREYRLNNRSKAPVFPESVPHVIKLAVIFAAGNNCQKDVLNVFHIKTRLYWRKHQTHMSFHPLFGNTRKGVNIP